MPHPPVEKSIQVIETGPEDSKLVCASVALFEEIAFIKDDPESFSVVLGFSKGYAHPRVPVLFSDESSYRGFVHIISENCGATIVVTAEELKVRMRHLGIR